MREKVATSSVQAFDPYAVKGLYTHSSGDREFTLAHIKPAFGELPKNNIDIAHFTR